MILYVSTELFKWGKLVLSRSGISNAYLFTSHLHMFNVRITLTSCWHRIFYHILGVVHKWRHKIFYTVSKRLWPLAYAGEAYEGPRSLTHTVLFLTQSSHRGLSSVVTKPLTLFPSGRDVIYEQRFTKRSDIVKPCSSTPSIPELFLFLLHGRGFDRAQPRRRPLRRRLLQLVDVRHRPES